MELRNECPESLDKSVERHLKSLEATEKKPGELLFEENPENGPLVTWSLAGTHGEKERGLIQQVTWLEIVIACGLLLVGVAVLAFIVSRLV